ncbi:MAG: PIN domain-containing protein [Peptococcaceae bacterium]|jgi:predicted nucleic acid-binding protein|nr:PIN domain-containing protein [Peptococcaceae bacterium]
MIYALDSNIISYMLKGDKQVQGRFQAEIENGNLYAVAPLVYYEVKRGLVFVNAKAKLREFDNLCKNGLMGDMNLSVWETVIELYVNLRRQGKPIEDADLFISAYCLVNSYTLVTNNTRHFENVNGLNLADWKA